MLEVDYMESAKAVAPHSIWGVMMAFFYQVFSKKHEEHRARAQVIFAKIDELRTSISDHAVEDARTYVSRNEMESLRSHIDHKFEVLTQQIIELPNRMRKS